MFTFKEIYEAYLQCRKRKRNTINALHYEASLIENLCNLETSLNNGTYKPKRSVCFLTTSPKLREVFAADFSDRVVHHVVVPLLEQIWEPCFIHDSYSNRKNRGIHHASKRAEHFMRGSRYYLQLDVKSFFYSINKEILFSKLKAKIISDYVKLKGTDIEMHEMLTLVYKIVWQDVIKDVVIKGRKKSFENIPSHKTLFKIARNKGLPIGNLTSQFFANVYMNDFDNFVKRKLKVKKYLRYVDDFVLFAEDKEKIMEHYEQIVKYLAEELELSLRDNYILKENKEGLDFLGYIIHPHYTLVRKRVVQNYKYKKAQYLDRYEALKGTMSLVEIKKFLSVQASFVGHVKHANSYNLLNKVGRLDEKNPFDYTRHECLFEC
jgi:retron-type reverse transcriptase